MKFERSSGILLHPSSLPGPYGIGDIGPQAHRWIDFLAKTRCSLWQVLPLGPTGYGDSPYQCFSAFAGNPYLISPEALITQNLLLAEDLADRPNLPADRINYGSVIFWKLKVLNRAYYRFKSLQSSHLQESYERFKSDHAEWLNDFALFMALKDAHNGNPWTMWEAPLCNRQPEALQEARQAYTEAIDKHIFRQFVFFQQWEALHAHAKEQGIQIIGDIPIFVAHDSSDVWANPELFYLDKKGKPAVVAGVPPDYFSATGQRWGNPLYRWKLHKERGYDWWLKRFRSVLSLVDIVRLDHFRGFAAYWEVPGDAETAVKGRWVTGPGADLFDVVSRELSDLPIIAEDLGVITPDVVALREQFGLPGMKIFQFAFAEDATDPFLPHNYPQNCVVYTGTHDNDTAKGWYDRINEKEKDFYRRYLARDGSDVSWDFIRAVWGSVAVYSLAPLQDFLSLGNEARMNYPGNPSGNWQWRVKPEAINEPLIHRIIELNWLYRRENPLQTPKKEIDKEEKAKTSLPDK